MLWISGLLAAGMMAAPPDTVRIRGDTPACSSCRLTVTPLVVLGSPGDTVGPDLQYWVAADSRGRYYVAPTIGLGQVAVYDSTGRLLGLLGRRGQGPGEFEHAGPVKVGPDDSLFVFDHSLNRLTVFDRDLKVARTQLLPVWPRNVLIRRSGEMVMQAMVPTPDRIGFPLHLVSRDGRILASYGAERPVVSRRHTAAQWPELAESTDPGAVWIASRDAYVLSLWRDGGARILTIVREVDWFPPRAEDVFVPEDAARPVPWIRGIFQDRQGLLWVLVSVADQQWRARPRAGGGVERRPVSNSEINRYVDTRIEVLDPSAGVLVAAVRHPSLLMGFVEEGLVFGPRGDDQGNEFVEIYRLALTGANAP
ncbi:MAG: hypothetical protein KatS3mg081_2110 [Gemmatimonadales bacterium]|nr:MAG: hypothetical protein KatS3mg081_2110 [Gemmatimonadales bacterium]